METISNLCNKVEGKMIMAKMKAGQKINNFFSKKKSGASHWVDLGIACLVGLAIAVVFKDKLTAVIEGVATKVSTQTSAW